jgi:hypothetical protein
MPAKIKGGQPMIRRTHGMFDCVLSWRGFPAHQGNPFLGSSALYQGDGADFGYRQSRVSYC